MIKPFEYESPFALVSVMARPPAAAIPDYREYQYKRKSLTGSETYWNHEEYAWNHDNEASTLEDSRVQVTKYANDKRSEEGHDIGMVEDVCKQSQPDAFLLGSLTHIDSRYCW